MKRMYVGFIGLSILALAALAMSHGPVSAFGSALSDQDVAQVYGGACGSFDPVDGCGTGVGPPGSCRIHTSYNSGTQTAGTTSTFLCVGGCG